MGGDVGLIVGRDIDLTVGLIVGLWDVLTNGRSVIPFASSQFFTGLPGHKHVQSLLMNPSFGHFSSDLQFFLQLYIRLTIIIS
jgi:hypothetical protein